MSKGDHLQGMATERATRGGERGIDPNHPHIPQFIQARLCSIHNKPLEDVGGDMLMCPTGSHLVGTASGWVVGRAPNPAYMQAMAERAGVKIASLTRGELKEEMPMPIRMEARKGEVGVAQTAQPIPPGRNPRQKAQIEGCSLHTKMGQTMRITLLRKDVHIVVKVQKTGLDKVKTSGILDWFLSTQEETAKAKYEERIQVAMEKGWKLGAVGGRVGLTDIPDPDPEDENVAMEMAMERREAHQAEEGSERRPRVRAPKLSKGEGR